LVEAWERVRPMRSTRKPREHRRDFRRGGRRLTKG
jgi:hypothetical protein